MKEEERLFILQCVADLAPLTNRAMRAARSYAINTKTKGTQTRFRRMRNVAEASYGRFYREQEHK